MFTIEMDTDAGMGITITTLDERDENDDVEVILYQDSIFFKQVDEEEGVQLIIMSPQQLQDIVRAIELPEGTYYQESSIGEKT